MEISIVTKNELILMLTVVRFVNIETKSENDHKIIMSEDPDLKSFLQKDIFAKITKKVSLSCTR